MRRARRLSHGRTQLAAVCWAVALFAAPPTATADLCTGLPPVFDNDPCDPAAGPYPMLPGLPLVLPADGAAASWRSGPPSINHLFDGDVDLAVRVGLFASETQVPPPAGSTGNPTLVQNVAGGGGSGQGSEIDFTVFVTDGPGSFPYGSVLTGPDLDGRPLAVFAFADLDGDGVIGPTNIDTGADNVFEKQEAIAHLGRAVGQIGGGRFSGTLGVQAAAPASIGGLVVALASGMYTGADANVLWSDGTAIFTQWPFFPPLDPALILYLTEPNPPDAEGPNILFYRPSDFLLTPPGDPNLSEAFAVAVDGANPSTDQFVSISGDSVGVGLFRNADASAFAPASRMVAKVAPDASGSSRTLVLPAGELFVTPGQVVELRVLPVDMLGNISDPPASGIAVQLTAGDGLQILAPDVDSNPAGELMSIDSAKGEVVMLGTGGVNGSATLTVADTAPQPLLRDRVVVFGRSGADPLDSDADGLADDGDASTVIGDHPCSVSDLVFSNPCDDNCTDVVNPAQIDSDGDGLGNCCDGTCVVDRNSAGCLECPQVSARFRALSTRVRSRIQPRAGISEDVVKVQARIQLGEGQVIAPDSELVEMSLAENERLHYSAQLPAVFVRKGSRPTYVYDDPSGSIAGVRKARIKSAGSGLYKLVLLARGFNLVDTQPLETLPRGLVFSLSIRDDAFSNNLTCASSLRSLRCAAGR